MTPRSLDRLRTAALPIAIATLLACGNTQVEPPPAMACVPGTQTSCACPGGSLGVQECNAEGSARGVCVCDAGSSSTTSSGAAPCHDTTDDPNNCGLCGHSCQGGLCMAAVCHPVRLASTPGASTALRADGESVYWIASGGDIMRVPAGGGPLVTVVSENAGYNQLAVDANYLYWIASKYENYTFTDTPRKQPKKGGAPTTLTAMPMYDGSGDDMIVVGTTMYWSTLSGLAAVSTNGGIESLLVVAPTDDGVNSLAANGEYLYWANNTAVMRQTLAGGCPTEFLATPKATGIVFDATSLYYVDAGNIRAIAIGGGSTRQVASGTGADSIAVDAASIYWTDTDVVKQAALRGGPVTTLATGKYVSGATIDATSVYWFDYDQVTQTTSVMKVAK